MCEKAEEKYESGIADCKDLPERNCTLHIAQWAQQAGNCALQAAHTDCRQFHRNGKTG